MPKISSNQMCVPRIVKVYTFFKISKYILKKVQRVEVPNMRD